MPVKTFRYSCGHKGSFTLLHEHRKPEGLAATLDYLESRLCRSCDQAERDQRHALLNNAEGAVLARVMKEQPDALDAAGEIFVQLRQEYDRIGRELGVQDDRYGHTAAWERLRTWLNIAIAKAQASAIDEQLQQDRAAHDNRP